MVEFMVYGQLYSMKNSRRGYYKHPKAQLFVDDFMKQVRRPAEPITGPVGVEYTVFYPSLRQDLDTALLNDCLEKVGIIANDRQIVEKHTYKHLDRDNPRVDIKLWEIPDDK